MAGHSYLRLLTLWVAFFAWLGGAAAEERKLIIYTWSGFFEHGVVEDFEKKFECEVVFEYFDSNERMLSNLASAGYAAFDIVVPSSYMASVMRERDMLLALDRSLMPNLGNIDPAFAELAGDSEMRFFVPFTRSITGVGYNEEAIGKLEPTWDVFGLKRHSRRMVMLDDMRQAIGAALKFSGFSVNSTDDGELAKAMEVLTRWNDQLLDFEVDEFHLGLEAGTHDVVQCYNGDIAFLLEDDSDYSFFIPREGTAISVDGFVIMADTPNRSLAHAFINHMFEPENAVRTMMESSYYMGVPKALDALSDELKNRDCFAISDELLAKSEVIRNLGSDNAKYERLWREFMTKTGRAERLDMKNRRPGR